MNNRKPKKNENNEKPKFVEGVDYYFESGLIVLTEHFLKKRGYCCDSGCRHCPYPKEEIPAYNK